MGARFARLREYLTVDEGTELDDRKLPEARGAGAEAAGPFGTHDAVESPLDPDLPVLGPRKALDASPDGSSNGSGDPKLQQAGSTQQLDLVDDQFAPEAKVVPVPADTTGKALHYAKAFVSEGHTAWDAFLSQASASVGQIILTYPYQLAIMGIIPGIFVGVGVGFLDYYTLWLLIVLYLHRKKTMVLNGTWYTTIDSNGFRRRWRVTQYHDIITYALGRWFGLIAQILTALTILGSGINQVVASASSQQSINPEYNKREWTLILGGPILIFGLLPSFRSVRLLNVIALIGTNFTCLWLIILAGRRGIRPGIFTRGPRSVQDFFLGAATVGTAGHSIAMEMMDSMRRSRKFVYTSILAWMWNLSLLLPHSIAIVLAFPDEIVKQANVYSVVPASGWKYFSVYSMLIHNIGAFTLHINPLLYMWEKLIGTHHMVWWVRIPSRIPVLAAIWVLSLAIPFYGTINSLWGSIGDGMLAFALPCLAFNWHFRTEARRRDSPLQPVSWLAKWNWKMLFTFNIALGMFFLATSTGCGLTFSVKKLIENINDFYWFPACYQCPKKEVIQAINNGTFLSGGVTFAPDFHNATSYPASAPTGFGPAVSPISL